VARGLGGFGAGCGEPDCGCWSLEEPSARRGRLTAARPSSRTTHTPKPPNKPAVGWGGVERMPVAEELEGQWPQPAHTDPDELEWRFPFDLMEEGLEVDGVVTDIWLHHGAQVDFVGEMDG
jgi:hypothetical protein